MADDLIISINEEALAKFFDAIVQGAVRREEFCSKLSALLNGGDDIVELGADLRLAPSRALADLMVAHEVAA